MVGRVELELAEEVAPPGRQLADRLVPGDHERRARSERRDRLIAGDHGLGHADDGERPPDSLAVEPREDVPRAIRPAAGPRHVESELVADLAGLERPEHGSRVGDRSFGREGQANLGPVWPEALLDLRPLLGRSHRRISIMAAR